MPSIEIRAGGPDIPDGVYALQLSEIRGDPDQPDKPRAWRDPVKNRDVYFWDWVFHTDDGTELSYGTSTSTGPRSKLFGLLTALLGGRAPRINESYDFNQLIGRMVLGTIQRQESGFVEIVSFSAIPVQKAQQNFAQQTGAAVQPQGAPAPAAPASPQPIRDQIGTDDLPF